MKPFRFRRLAAGLGIIVLLLVSAITAFGAFLPAERLARYLGESGSGRFGREFSINGPLTIDWHWRTPRIRAQDVRLANAPGSRDPHMLQIETLDFTISIWKFLRGRTELPELTLIHPRLVLEKFDAENANWNFPALSEGAAVAKAALPEERDDFPVIGLLQIREGTLVYRDKPRRLDLDLELDTATGSGADRGFSVAGKGTLEDRKFDLKASGGSLDMLRDSSKPFPLAIDLVMGATRVNLAGTFKDPVQLRGIEATLKLAGNNMADLFYLTGIPLPPTPPYALAGDLVKQGDSWSYQKFTGTVGDSDLAGNLSYDTEGDRNYLKANLTSEFLDMDDLGGFIGQTPGTGPGETVSAEQQAEAKKREAAPRLIPDVPINLARLRAADMDVQLNAEKLNAPGWPFKGLDVRFELQKGVLTLNPLRFDLADGSGAGVITFDGSGAIPLASAKLDLQKISLGRFFDGTRFENHSQGAFGSHIELKGSGLSLARILAGSDGQVVVTMAGGRISLLLVEAADIDIAEAAPLLLGEDRSAYIRCGVADFTVNKGLLTSKIFVLDTTDSNVQGDVTIDLRSETIKARAQAHSKDPSLLAVQTPILISGPLKKPQVGIDPVEAGARTAGAVALGALLTPLAAIIPFIELGVGEDSECGELIAQARASANRSVN